MTIGEYNQLMADLDECERQIHARLNAAFDRFDWDSYDAAAEDLRDVHAKRIELMRDHAATRGKYVCEAPERLQ